MTVNGVTIYNVTVNAAGVVNADVVADCGASTASFTLRVTDSGDLFNEATLNVAVNPNPSPTLSYTAQTVTAGTTPLFNPASGPADNGSVASIAVLSVMPPTGLTLSVNNATGQVLVTSATLVGSYNVVIRASDNCAPGAGSFTDTGFTVNVICPTLTLSPISLPNAMVNTAYPQTISASPDGTAYSFAVSSGSLPSGLTLNTEGTFSGEPAQSGLFNFRIAATGFGVCSGSRDYVLIVECPAITVNPSSLPGGTVGAAYNQMVTATPAGSYNFGVTSGALPLGLSLNAASGAITGTPSQEGSFSFTIMASAGGCTGSRNYTVTIGCEGVTITTATLPAGSAGTAYSQPITVSPAAPAWSYSFSLYTGSLPSGLTLNPVTGVIGGLPGNPGSFSFTIRAQINNGCAATHSYVLTINCPAITLSALPTPALNSPYNQTVTASPLAGSHSFAVTSGALPAGLTLNPATGLVSGTPATAGAYNFTITSTGFGTCTGSRVYTGNIAGDDCPNITLPDLPAAEPGQLYSNSVTASPSGNYNYLVTSGSLPPGLILYGNLGFVYGYPTMAGTFDFTITASGLGDSNDCTGSKTYSLSIGGSALATLVFGDFDGDGKTDLSVWRGQAGEWLVVRSGEDQSGPSIKLQTEMWGTASAPYYDVMVPGDYDGDGRMDLAVFRKSTGTWLIKGSKNSAITSKVWGVGTDTPVAADYDGDGRTDIAVWRGVESNWLILRSSDQQTETVSWGTSNAPYRDLPVPADYDGDGKTDIAVFRQANGHWYIRLSSDGSLLDKSWGVGTDVPVTADYDGDGKADIAVWRGTETNWYVLRSSDGQTQAVSWGTPTLGDVPVPGDYDGDGKADVAVWRASNGNWYVKLSSDGFVMTRTHGQAGDKPIPAKLR